METFNIKFEHISGIKNTLADTLSRIIKVDSEAQPECEKEGYEFDYSCFKELLPVKVFEVEENWRQTGFDSITKYLSIASPKHTNGKGKQ